jgi:hypothetical protein
MVVCSVCHRNLDDECLAIHVRNQHVEILELWRGKKCSGDIEVFPDWIKREIMPTWNFHRQSEEVDQCFLKAVNTSVHKRKDRSRFNFTIEGYKDIPTDFPVEIKTMIDFGKANKLDLHLYKYAKIDPEFVKEVKKIINIDKEGVVYPVYNSERGTYDAKVFLLLHDEHVFAVRYPLAILRPELKSSYTQYGKYCLKCGTVFSSPTVTNKHYDICLTN